MKRGQIQLVWVIIELILVVVSGFALFTVVNRARDTQLPLQHYAARELSFTRSAMDVFAGTNAYYDLAVPGISFKWPTSYAAGSIQAGSVRTRYSFDVLLVEEPFAHLLPNTIPIEVAGRTVIAGPDMTQQTRKLLLGCVTKDVPGTIAIIPTSRETQLLATNLIARNPARYLAGAERVDDPSNINVKQQVVNDAGAVLVLRSVPGERVLGHVNVNGDELACRLVNALLPELPLTKNPTTDAAIIPLSSDFREQAPPAAWLTIGKPGVILTIGTQYLTNADAKLHEALA